MIKKTFRCSKEQHLIIEQVSKKLGRSKPDTLSAIVSWAKRREVLLGHNAAVVNGKFYYPSEGKAPLTHSLSVTIHSSQMNYLATSGEAIQKTLRFLIDIFAEENPLTPQEKGVK